LTVAIQKWRASSSDVVGQRVFGIGLDYEDINDHNDLRHDPIMAVLAGRVTAGARSVRR
jgi:hypothetical protein